MKEIINYYYNFDIQEIMDYSGYSTFKFNGEDFYFVFFNRTKDELKDIIKISYELKIKGIRVHDIIINRDKEVLTKVGEEYYILLKINGKKDELVSFDDLINYSNRLKLTNYNGLLYRNHWGLLWSNKIDYFEYQIKEIGKEKKIILDSFSYYVGLAENAISYVNNTNKNIKLSEMDSIVLSHRRIFWPNTYLNYFNPLSYIFDLSIRDVAEYLKTGFFNKNDSLLDLKLFLKSNKLSNYSYHMLFARLLYPSYYFDVYEDIMNNNGDENKLINIINKVEEYETFLKEAFNEISKYTLLSPIKWL